jgi:hypothetical protein
MTVVYIPGYSGDDVFPNCEDHLPVNVDPSHLKRDHVFEKIRPVFRVVPKDSFFIYFNELRCLVSYIRMGSWLRTIFRK